MISRQKARIGEFMNQDQKSTLIFWGIAMKAGKLVTGEDLTLKEIEKRQAKGSC